MQPGEACKSCMRTLAETLPKCMTPRSGILQTATSTTLLSHCGVFKCTVQLRIARFCCQLY